MSQPASGGKDAGKAPNGEKGEIFMSEQAAPGWEKARGKDCEHRNRQESQEHSRQSVVHGPHLCFSPSSSPSLSCLVLGSPSSLSCKGRKKTTCSLPTCSP